MDTSASQHASLGIDHGKPSTFFVIQNELIYPNNTLHSGQEIY